MNKKLWKISMGLLIAKLLMWIVWVGFIVYGNDWFLTNDQIMFWLAVDMGWLFIMAFWGIGVWCK